MRRESGTATRNLLALVVFLALVTVAAGFGGLFRPGAWYENLAKPAWTPPGALFAPVWTVLYLTITLAGWLTWLARGDRGSQRGDRRVRAAFAFYVLQLALNALWSLFFFGLQRPGLAFTDIVALWIAILGNVVLFYGTRPVAGLLLIPYLAWVTFAAGLNLAIWRLNL